ncbi:hypothetical protein Droror1_Dr00025143 [Drosera rotundifolia]
MVRCSDRRFGELRALLSAQMLTTSSVRSSRTLVGLSDSIEDDLEEENDEEEGVQEEDGDENEDEDEDEDDYENDDV